MLIHEVFQAQQRIRSIARKTPIFSARTVDHRLGCQLFLKAENLQKTGSFKIRGAANYLVKRCEKDEPISGVVAASSGNHGQAVACVAAMFKKSAIIVMPENATKAKVDAAVGYGARVEFCGLTSSERLERARQISHEEGYLLVPPYDHPDIIAGQGTLGIEIVADVPDVDLVYVPIGGGGLASGVAFAIKALRPDIRVIGVEPAQSNSMYVSRQAGERRELASTQSIADGLLTLMPGELTFPLIQEYVDDVVLVEEEEIRAAMRLCLERFKLLAEPSGAVSVAAACQGESHKGQKAVAIVSGGNVDLARLGEYFQDEPCH